jgi:hypothetical protein
MVGIFEKVPRKKSGGRVEGLMVGEKRERELCAGDGLF